MIALIVLVALAVVAGVVVGVIALMVVIIKALAGAIRGPRPATTLQPSSAADIPDPVDDREFQRIVAREWPSN